MENNYCFLWKRLNVLRHLNSGNSGSPVRPRSDLTMRDILLSGPGLSRAVMGWRHCCLHSWAA